jgi:hypothetical protein
MPSGRLVVVIVIPAADIGLLKTIPEDAKHIKDNNRLTNNVILFFIRHCS